MSKRKPGQWWDRSWSVVTGCSWPEGQVPEGCRNCWARALARRFPAAHGTDPSLGQTEGYQRVIAGESVAADFGTVLCHPDRLDIPLRVRKSTTWAVSLMGDLFHPDVPSHFIRDVLRVPHLTAQSHRYVVLTKRWDRVQTVWDYAQYPLVDTIILASVWDQTSTDAACAEFADLPLRWGLHMEPLLGPVDMAKTVTNRIGATMPSWIVVGPENGPGKRPCDPQWIESIEGQCHAARMPVWRKDNEGPKEVPW